MKDLVVLAADKDLELTLRGLFSRPQAIGIREISYSIFIESEHDPACAMRGVQSLAIFAAQYQHALLIFDHEGCGKENLTKEKLSGDLNEEFVRSAWGDRAKAIVISPELEAWVWSDSPHVDEIAGWQRHRPGLRSWLRDHGWLQQNEVKPESPKEAFEAALRERKIPRSSSLYLQMAQKVSLKRCVDPSFNEFCNLLRQWFPANR
jgi:hypothetical protein